MRALIADVSPDAEPTHPAVRALIAFRATLEAPWWAGGGTAYLRIGGMCADGRTNTAVGLDLMRRFADCSDWGADPSLPCDCAGCQRRARLGVHLSYEAYKSLGLFCERRETRSPERPA